MKAKFVHPIWTNLPSFAALIVLVVAIFTNGPFPASVAIHFGTGGKPNAYGTPWSVFGLIIGISVLFIAISVIIDELWARQEKTKMFNWFSLLDDIVVGTMVGITLGYLAFLRHNDALFRFSWGYFGLVGGGTTALAVLLEIVRPYHHYQGTLVERENEVFKADIVRHLNENSVFFYWDYQNPFYVTILTIALPVVLLVAAVLSWFSQPSASLILIIVALLLIMPYGGQRVLVTRQNVTIRWGIMGFRVLRLKTEEITGAETIEFSPLRDFGGYGIRANSQMSGYFLRGNRGVKLTTGNGKKYLIGSDNADRLAIIISSIITN